MPVCASYLADVVDCDVWHSRLGPLRQCDDLAKGAQVIAGDARVVAEHVVVRYGNLREVINDVMKKQKFHEEFFY